MLGVEELMVVVKTGNGSVREKVKEQEEGVDAVLEGQEENLSVVYPILV